MGRCFNQSPFLPSSLSQKSWQTVTTILLLQQSIQEVKACVTVLFSSMMDCRASDISCVTAGVVWTNVFSSEVLNMIQIQILNFSSYFCSLPLWRACLSGGLLTSLFRLNLILFLCVTVWIPPGSYWPSTCPSTWATNITRTQRCTGPCWPATPLSSACCWTPMPTLTHRTSR